jgi:hypothetical protein
LEREKKKKKENKRGFRVFLIEVMGRKTPFEIK